jgi:hypothetical protein
VHDLAAERPAQRRGHLAAREMVAGDADGLADELAAALEDAVGASADILGGDARQLAVTIGRTNSSFALEPFLGPMPKWIRLSQ